MEKAAENPEHHEDVHMEAGSSEEDGADSSSVSSSDQEDGLSDGDNNPANIEKLEHALAQNPYNFQDHVEYVKILRKNGLLEKLREARKYMSAIFPLGPDMWLEWTHDEARLISSSEDIAAVEDLYERGLQDYLSVPLWLEYLNFKRKHDKDILEYNETGINKMRELFERSLSATSLHFTDGSKVWATYRQFEMDLLNNLSDSMGDVKEKQVNVIRNLYRRQLSVPLCDASTTLEEYSKWESEHGAEIGRDTDLVSVLPTNVAMSYRKSLEMGRLREPLEEKISKDKPRDGDVLRNYEAYISLEEGSHDPARVQILYERAVAEYPVTPDLWLKYTDYLERNLRVHQIILSIYGRAVRNCPWIQTLWGRYLLAMERANSSESDISKVFEKSLTSGFGFSTPEEYLDHYLIRADGIRRQIQKSDDTQKERLWGILRETFTEAAQTMSTYFPDFVDRSLKLHSYWARLEATIAKDVTAARGVWENLIKSIGFLAEVWEGYIAMEISLGNLAEARTIYRKCYSKRLEGDGSERICEAWLNFEREFGSLEDYDRAYPKISARLVELKQLEQKQEEKSAAAVTAKDEKVSRKRAKSAVADQSKRSSVNDDDPRKGKQSTNKRPKVPTAADGDTNMEIKAPGNAGHDSSKVDEKSGSKNGADVKQRVWYTDQCTAYVSRLAPKVNEDDLKDFFNDCGGIKEVRLMKDYNTGLSRGFAYVDFDSEEGLEAAIKKHTQKLMGSKIVVLRSNPSLSGKKSGKKTSSHRDQRDQETDGQDGHREVDGDHIRQDGHPMGRPRPESSRGRGRGGRGGSSFVSHRRGGHVQLSGKNTFAAPRAVMRHVKENEAPKSNEDFRKMLSKE